MIKTLILNYENENAVKITKFHVSNFISKTDKVIWIGIPTLCIEFKQNQLRKYKYFVMKIPTLYRIEHEAIKQNMFDREVHFYKTLLPKLYELGNCEPFAPKLYAATDTKAFIIENFSTQGYYCGDQLKQLDLDESFVSLTLLAKYHALGYTYLQSLSKDDRRMSLIRSYQPLLTGISRSWTFREFCELLEPSLPKGLYKKIVKMENNILAEPRITEYPAENCMTVIIHGDYRTSNILFKKENDKVTQGKLIDWQLSRQANPALDLIYFFVTSVPIDIFQENDDLLINCYLDELNSILSSVQGTRFYHRPELNRDLLYYKYYYLKLLLVTWPSILKIGPPGDQTDAYIASAVKWVNYFERRGYIN